MAGLLNPEWRLPGLLGDPSFQQMLAVRQQQQPAQPPPTPTPPLTNSGGGIGHALASIFGGMDDPNLTPEQNAAARKQALLQAGLGILASDREGLGGIAEGALYGQQAGQQIRQQTYGRTQQERVQNALSNPAVVGKLTPEEQQYLHLLDPADALKYLGDRLKPAAPQVVDGKLVGNDGTVVYDSGPKLPELTAEDRLLAIQLGIDPTKPLSADDAKRITDAADARKKPLVNVNVGEQQDFTRTSALAKDFEASIKDHQVSATAYGTVLAAAKDPSPSGDIALLTAYMKLLDPNSVVREGEFATAQNAGSVPERIRAAYNKAVSGERLTPEQRTDFIGRAGKIADQRRTQLAPIIKRYTARATAAKVDPAQVVFDPFDEIGAAPANPFAHLIPGAK